jgi:hypothetical protein
VRVRDDVALVVVDDAGAEALARLDLDDRRRDVLDHLDKQPLEGGALVGLRPLGSRALVPAAVAGGHRSEQDERREGKGDRPRQGTEVSRDPLVWLEHVVCGATTAPTVRLRLGTGA